MTVGLRHLAKDVGGEVAPAEMVEDLSTDGVVDARREVRLNAGSALLSRLGWRGATLGRSA